MAALAAVDREVRAARAILFDADCEEVTAAALHVARAWAALAEAASPEKARRNREDLVETLSREGLAPEEDGWAQSLRRIIETAEIDPWDTGASAPSRQDLLRQCRWLEGSLRTAKRRMGVRLRPACTGSAFRLRATLGAVMTLAVVAMLWPRDVGRPSVWRAAFYPNTEFSGEPVRSETDAIFFDWGDGAPLVSFPEDDFSATFDSCLVIPEPTRIRFVLGSDDGSRLLLDDQVIIDNWGAHDFRTADDERTYEAGRYHLRVEYFEKVGGARLGLWAVIEGGPLEPLSPEWLSLPADDGDDPCRGEISS